MKEGNRFPSSCRFHWRSDFNRVRQDGIKIHTPNFIVIVLNRTCGPIRLGLTVSRKVGGAVQRNRVKRWAREFFRTHYHQLPPHSDISIIAKKGASELNYPRVCKELNILTKSFFPPRTSCSANLSSVS